MIIRWHQAVMPSVVMLMSVDRLVVVDQLINFLLDVCV